MKYLHHDGGGNVATLDLQGPVYVTAGSRLNLTSHMGCNCLSMINS